MTDIEIAKNTKLDEINKIAEKLEIKEGILNNMGNIKQKFLMKYMKKIKARIMEN